MSTVKRAKKLSSVDPLVTEHAAEFREVEMQLAEFAKRKFAEEGVYAGKTDLEMAWVKLWRDTGYDGPVSTTRFTSGWINKFRARHHLRKKELLGTSPPQREASEETSREPSRETSTSIEDSLLCNATSMAEIDLPMKHFKQRALRASEAHRTKASQVSRVPQIPKIAKIPHLPQVIRHSSASPTPQPRYFRMPSLAQRPFFSQIDMGPSMQERDEVAETLVKLGCFFERCGGDYIQCREYISQCGLKFMQVEFSKRNRR